MTSEEIKDLIRKYHEEAWNKGNLAVVDEFYAPNYTGYDLSNGQKFDREQMKQNLAQVDYTGVHITIDDIVVEGNRAALRWSVTATGPQGQPAKITGIAMYTFVDGKVAEDYYIGVMVNSVQPAA